MQAAKGGFEGLEARGGGFDDEEGFGGLFHLALPTVDGFDLGDEVDAGCEVLLDEGRGDALRFFDTAGGGECDACVVFVHEVLDWLRWQVVSDWLHEFSGRNYGD